MISSHWSLWTEDKPFVFPYRQPITVLHLASKTHFNDSTRELEGHMLIIPLSCCGTFYKGHLGGFITLNKTHLAIWFADRKMCPSAIPTKSSVTLTIGRFAAKGVLQPAITCPESVWKRPSHLDAKSSITRPCPHQQFSTPASSGTVTPNHLRKNRQLWDSSHVCERDF